MPHDEDLTSGFGAIQKCQCGHLQLAHELEGGCRIVDFPCEMFELATADFDANWIHDATPCGEIPGD